MTNIPYIVTTKFADGQILNSLSFHAIKNLSLGLIPLIKRSIFPGQF